MTIRCILIHTIAREISVRLNTHELYFCPKLSRRFISTGIIMASFVSSHTAMPRRTTEARILPTYKAYETVTELSCG